MSQLFKNSAKSRLTEALGSGDGLTFTVTTGEGALFPVLTADDHMLLTLENASGQKEIIRVSGRTGDVFTINPTPGSGRGQDGTTPMGFAAGDLVELRLTAGFIDALKEGSFVFVVDGGGAAIGPGVKGFIEAPFYGTIKSCRLFADIAGDITINIYKTSYEGYDPSNLTGDDVTPVGGISIAGGIKDQFTDLSSWSARNFNKGDIFVFNISACNTITKLTISLTVDRY